MYVGSYNWLLEDINIHSSKIENVLMKILVDKLPYENIFISFEYVKYEKPYQFEQS